jgi:hypothetical protein
MTSPLNVVANAAHEYSDTLPPKSEDRALLFSRRYGFAEAALKALRAHGYAIVRLSTVNQLEFESGCVPEHDFIDPSRS